MRAVTKDYSFTSLSNRKLWEKAFAALQKSQMETFFIYLEALRRRFIKLTADKNYHTSSRRNLLASGEGPVSPSADAFDGYYKKGTRPQYIHPSSTNIKKAYILHFYLAAHAYFMTKNELDPVRSDYKLQLERLMRYELFYKILSNFLPELNFMEGEGAAVILLEAADAVKKLERELRAAHLRQAKYGDLDNEQKERILNALEAEWSITLPLERMEALLQELKLGVEKQAFKQRGELVNERDKRELDALLEKRRALTVEADKQVASTILSNRNQPYLGFHLSDEQVLALLQAKDFLYLSEEQVNSMLDRISGKCENFSPQLYTNPDRFVKDRVISLTPEFKAAVIANCVGLSGRSWEVYCEIKAAELNEKIENIKRLDDFIIKTEIVTYEDLRGLCLIALNNILLHLQAADEGRWMRCWRNNLLDKKIAHIEQAINSIRQGFISSKDDLLKKIRGLHSSNLMNQHRHFGFFRSAPWSAKQLQALATECDNAEQTFKERATAGYTSFE